MVKALIEAELKRYVVRLLPGYYSLITEIIRAKFQVDDPMELFMRRPSQILRVLEEYYGDIMSAEIVFYEVFLKPLTRILRRKIDDTEILCMVRESRDREVIDRIVKAYMEVVK